jgi:DNA repair exonuclease SbcCD nuclease subunit
VGRLAHLYSQQNCSRIRAVRLAEWFIHRTKMLYMIGGNHDAWSGDDDPIQWISKKAQVLYQPSQVRIQLNFPTGDPMTINARHDFKGHSQYNPAHGPMKALLQGIRDDLAVAGHRHESAYSVLKDPDTGRIGHALKVASYKTFDRYALDGGFKDQTLSPCALTVLRPALPMVHPDRLKLFWDPEEGADYLTYRRKKGS